MLPPNPLLLTTTILLLASECSAKRNLKAEGVSDPLSCYNPCDMGGCEFMDCNHARISCKGGGCTIVSSTEPKCEGGGCTFMDCDRPTCRGGKWSSKSSRSRAAGADIFFFFIILLLTIGDLARRRLHICKLRRWGCS